MKWFANNWHWILLIIFAAGYVNQYTAVKNAVEIARVRQELADLVTEKTGIENRVGELEAEQIIDRAIIKEKETEIAANQAEIERLEVANEAAWLDVRTLDQGPELVQEFMNTWPVFARMRDVGVTQIPDEDGDPFPYFVLPLGSLRTFIIEHNNLANVELRLQEYRNNEALYGDIIEASARITQLEEEKTAAYKEGYESAFGRYEALNERYISCREEPRFQAPNWTVGLGCAAGVVGGIYLGSQFR